jgi:polysaccharide deacetylase family protein (PEP-CTERM system associated)
MPDAPRFPYRPRPDLLEIPVTTAVVLNRNLPAGGGGYFRFAPYGVSRWAIDRFNRDEQAPAIFYMHPWEIDPLQPRVPGPGLKTRFRHYVNLHRTESRLDRLLGDFRWGRMDHVFGISR